MSDLKMFFIDKDICDMLYIETFMEDNLCRHAIEMKQKSK